MANGVEFDLAMKLDDVVRSAWCIIFNEIKTNRKFDFVSRQFIDPDIKK